MNVLQWSVEEIQGISVVRYNIIRIFYHQFIPSSGEKNWKGGFAARKFLMSRAAAESLAEVSRERASARTSLLS